MQEITVLGAGVFGLSVAWSCLRRGARVRVLETRSVGAGSSGGIVGALAPHTPENWNEKKQFQLESLLMAEAWWSEIAEVSGHPTGYLRSGRLQPVADGRELELAKARAHSAETLWGDHARWEVRKSDVGWCPSSPSGLVIHDTLSARIHPKDAVTSLAEAICRKGGIIEEGYTGSKPSGPVLEATGYEGLLEMSDRLSQPVGNGVKGQAVLLQFDAREAPQIFADALHIVPHHDGTVAVGSTSERDWDDPDTTNALLDNVLERALSAFPILGEAEVLARWAGVRPRAKSRAPMLGQDPERPDVLIANGGFKIGFGMAPKIGDVMADLILEGKNAIPDSFRVEASLR